MPGFHRILLLRYTSLATRTVEAIREVYLACVRCAHDVAWVLTIFYHDWLVMTMAGTLLGNNDGC